MGIVLKAQLSILNLQSLSLEGNGIIKILVHGILVLLNSLVNVLLQIEVEVVGNISSCSLVIDINGVIEEEVNLSN